MTSVPEIFGSLVFDDRAMRSMLPGGVYESLRLTIDQGKRINPDIADVVAGAMKDWAISKGATHYAHWFQPLAGMTAEKHDSFIEPGPGGCVLMEFSGKELIKGEPDASSFPSGGIRATFEARGYTAWDPTSYAFIKGKTLCIPTAFCSYNGEALDKKTPLLRSMEALNTQALRILRLFGNTSAKRVIPYVGPEQEYFLISREVYDKRDDLKFTGRTLFGAKPPKGQQMDDHYFGVIKPRIQAFMEELNEELWKLGVLAKTEHNEAAPAQHELAPIYAPVNAAADQNHITMEMMQKIAARHGMVCLLHEKPFAGLNGSGKHNNWSLGTDRGENLLNPGSSPSENAQFLLFLCAVIKAVDDYQDLLRLSVATAGNDHRLGANEAPPAVISIFLGDELDGILEAIEQDKPYEDIHKKTMKLGVDAIPRFTQDSTDRNRTSPLAFTGNKFEFRMLGSSDSIACANIMMNTAVAESLRIYADRLEKAEDFNTGLHEMIKKTIRDHRRIIFNGNGYEEAWIEEAAKRGLSNHRTTPDAMPHLLDEKNVEMLTSHRVYTKVELESRCEIMLDNYSKHVIIEARTMVNMAKKDIMPALVRYSREVAQTANEKRSFLNDISCEYEESVVRRNTELLLEISKKTDALEEAVDASERIKDIKEQSFYIRDNVIPAMEKLRIEADSAELYCDRKYWPLPTYGEMLFSI